MKDAAALTIAAKDKLKAMVAKIERVEEERREMGVELRDIYAEAKSMGYDVKALKSTVSIRRKDRQEREEQQAVLDVYLLALGEI